MAEWDGGVLSEAQRRFVAQHLSDPRVIADMSWGQVDTAVLRVADGGGEFVVKAAGTGNHHIGREITAHEHALTPLRERELSPRMVAGDRAANALIATYLPGTLAEGTDAERSADIHEQAGRALRLLHGQSGCADDGYEARVTATALARLDAEHRIEPAQERRARGILRAYEPAPVTLVPTHGDFQPRNWIVDGGMLRVIDFGRFDRRPAATDLCRLAVQQWRDAPDLEAAFLRGYGSDPRDPELWRIDLLREAVGTAVWAHQVGDVAFEAQGHRMLADALGLFD